MIPPFFTVDHRVDSSPLPFEERRVLRRSAPSRLRFDPPSPEMPVLRPSERHRTEPLREAPGSRFARFVAMVRLWVPA